jgi:signal transduction histidine kinase
LPPFLAGLAWAVTGALLPTTQSLTAIERIAMLVIGQGSLGLVLFGARRFVVRDPHDSRPLLVLAAIVSACVVRLAMVGAFVTAVAGSENARWTERVVGAIVTLGLILAVAGVAVSAIRFRRNQIAVLLATQGRLQAVLESNRNEVAEQGDAAVEQIRLLLLSDLRRLGSDDALGTAADLKRFASEVVRPLSHALTDSRPLSDVSPPRQSLRRVSWIDMLDVRVVGRPFRPLLTFVLQCALALGPVDLSWPQRLELLIPLSMVAFVLFGLNSVLARALNGRSRRVRFVVIFVLLGCVSVFAGLCILLFVGTQPPGPTLAFAASVSTALSFVFTIIVLTIEDRARVAHEEARAAERLARLLACDRQARWVYERALSRALHGPIQSAVYAAALRIESSLKDGQAPSGLMSELQEELFEVLVATESVRTGRAVFWEAMRRLEATWRGVCEVRIDWRSESDFNPSENSPALTCLQDLLIEFVSNSVRHGSATRVDLIITISDTEDGTNIDLEATSDSPSVRQEERGIGSRMLDDWTLQWSIHSDDDSTRLAFTLPA